MNKIHRTVWNATLNTWVAAPENARTGRTRSARARRRLATVLGSVLALAALSGAPPALANGGAGGRSFTGVPGGVGGSGSGVAGSPGVSTPLGPNGAGGGGGGSAGSGLGAGGAGGVGGDGDAAYGMLGGAGGTATLLDGGAGGASDHNHGAGGGGGGHSALTEVNLSNTASVTGGAGGAGGAQMAAAFNGGGGGGGEGGAAAVVTGGGASANTGILQGGVGGAGGNSLGGGGGSGGDGGLGAQFTGSGATFTNDGSITGGRGGMQGSGVHVSVAGQFGQGGAGIVGADLSVINSGSIAGGLSGDGVTQANAITFSGLTNRLELQAGYSITGNVMGSTQPGATNALVLGGATDASFGVELIGTQYQNFNGFSKTGASTWALTGTTTALTPWTVSGGTLSIADDASLGALAGALTLDGGTLQTTADITTSRAVTLGAGGGTFRPDADTVLSLFGAVSGSGSLTMSGTGTLVLNNGNSLPNTYTGGTTLNSGTLFVVTAGALGTGELTINGGTIGGALANDTIVNGSFTTIGARFEGNMALHTTPVIDIAGPDSAANGVISGAHGITFDKTSTTLQEFEMAGSSANTYTGTTTVQGNAVLGLFKSGAVAVPGALVIRGNGVVGLARAEQIADHASVTVNSEGRVVNTLPGGQTLSYEGLVLATWGVPGLTETIGSLYGNGTVGLGDGRLRVGAGDFSGAISNGDYATFIAGLGVGAVAAGNLEKYGPGTLTLSGHNSYTGSTEITGGTLRAGAANTFSPTSATTIAVGATLDLAGYNQTLAALNNSGTVSLAGSAPGTTLTVTGPWVGNGGTLALGTALGDNASATDRLVLSGSTAVASGSTKVAVTNLGGLGGLTSGNGIELISAQDGASIGTGAFSLASPVAAGAYEYRLNTTSTGGYLSSTTTTPVVPVTPVIPVTPDAPAAPASLSVPTYRAEVPLYAALPEQLRQANLAMLGSLHQRMGDDGARSANPEQGERQAWGRILTVDRDIAQGGTVSPTSNGRLTGFQAGTDLWATPNWRAGVYVGRLEGDMKVSGFARGIAGYAAGQNDLKNEYLGGYLTYRTDSGFYADGVLQAGRHRTATSTSFGGPSGSNKASSLLASVEVGQAFALGAGWSIEPQLQLVHQNLNLHDSGLIGATVQQDAHNGWAVRAGLRVKGEFVTSAGTVQPYARLNVWHTSSGTDRARFIGPAAYADILTSTGGTSTEAALGATWQVSPAVGVYGELGQLWASGGSAKTKGGPNASLGVKVRW